MDYRTRPVSRKNLRYYSILFRKLFDVSRGGPFPVLQALEHVPDVFPNCDYIVVEDYCLPAKTMARCISNDRGGFTIEIKQSVYDGAYNRHIGAYLGFICHEMCHIFLFKIGYTPVFECSFNDNTLPPYCSVEWQTKALCSEVMIPYKESTGMSINEICKTYQCSRGFAESRKRLERR